MKAHLDVTEPVDDNNFNLCGINVIVSYLRMNLVLNRKYALHRGLVLEANQRIFEAD
jgi:hypothetical protein